MIPGSVNPLLLKKAAAAGGYQIQRSVRFNSSDSAYLSRTPASAGNRKTWTWAGWVKRSGLGARQGLFGSTVTGAPSNLVIEFDSSDRINIVDSNAAGGDSRTTTSVYRDPSSWYHIVVAYDTTQATANNRARLYVNGVEVTVFSVLSNPSQNADGQVNAVYQHSIGAHEPASASFKFNGYLADIHFIDGQALTPSSFGEFDANGIWQPKAYTGTYGTNGFKLNFSDNSTAAALGTDSSGNGNTWTVNNISVAAGAGNDSVVDSPTNYGTDTGAGAEVRGNYCTLNPLKGGSPTNGNLEQQNSSPINFGTIGVSSGKWYFETVITTQTSGGIKIGVAQQTATGELGDTATAWAILGQSNVNNGQAINNGSLTSSYTTFAQGDVVNCAFDLDSGKIWWGKNGTWLNSGNPASGTNAIYSNLSGTIFPAATANQGGYLTWNFGQRAFAYTAPSGFKALCTQNLPTPLIAQPSTAMDVKLYTGNGSTQTISGLGFSPDLVWYKHRSGASSHGLFDIVRGTSNYLTSNGTGAEISVSGVTAFNSDGFTLGSDPGGNGSGTWVAWCWDAGSSTVTNTQGSITSSVRANASAGISIVSWNANNTANQSIGHGLGVTPAFIIHKNRTSASNWNCWFTGFTSDEYINLNGTGAKANTGGNLWYQTPTSSVFYIGFTGSAINNGTDSIISYCFAPVAGYSSFGSYTGNGSTNGPFVYTGFRPRWLCWKNITSTENWVIMDANRDPHNVVSNYLFPNSSAAEGSAAILDILSNGFKMRNAFLSSNAASNTYIYFAVAESPFQYARAR